MNYVNTYHRLVSAALALLVLNAVIGKELHHLLDHHHDEVLHCEGGDTHLHSEEYAPADCFVCYFHFSPVEDPVEGWTVKDFSVRRISTRFYYRSPNHQSFYSYQFPRGPPLG